MDKVLLKAAGIVAIIVGIFSCITIIGLLWGIPLIIGGNKFLKFAVMDDEELLLYRDSILGWSIFFFFFTVVAGIIGLIYYIGMVKENTNNTSRSSKDDYIEELKRLKELYDSRAITQEEYEQKKKQILNL